MVALFVTVTNAVHPRKQEVPKDVIDDGIVAELNATQSLKHSFGIDVMEVGRLTEESEEQLRKHAAPRDVMDVGMVMVVNAEHSLKQSIEMAVSALGMFTVVKDVQVLKH